MKVTEENRAELIKWAEALESGKYKQGTRYLRNIDDEYCCLGVICSINNVEFYNPGGGVFHIKECLTGSLASLPELISKIGMNGYGSFSYLGEDKYKEMFGTNIDYISSLVDMNDKARHNFKDIAKFLRAAAESEDSFFK